MNDLETPRQHSSRVSIPPTGKRSGKRSNGKVHLLFVYVQIDAYAVLILEGSSCGIRASLVSR